jgi:hypothetical protein
MRNHKKKRSSFLFLIILTFLISCKRELINEVELNNKNLGKFSGIKIIKDSSKNYKLILNELGRNQLNLLVERDTIFVIIESAKQKIKHPFFIQNNFRQEKDTMFLDYLAKYQSVIIVRKPNIIHDNICNSDIIFKSNKRSTIGYSIWFSFEKGMLQILTKDNVCIEVLTLYPTLEYKTVNQKEGNLYL